ncbi:MAG: hypothetical protein ACLR9T_06340 [Thomasclavelia sp.]|uniref:hypothetical protein n=1 Tax=Thomasclavelia sp. TaxID=3025757 RepID=UPI0039A0A369
MLIKDSNKKMRKEYIENLFKCKNGDCDNCGICQIFKGISPEEVYYDYIEGICELNEISKCWNERRYDEKK